ncbi:EF-hand domain-containing protein [Porphyrobacter sp. GA68]|uniref:EF-hand domain-containing protein n=1 Tax=Porphyrobacter sp. GA68 TaxID=2883480 RepID=UPI001D194990|nr:EF-hand domain-containing protein [Porphyrobacter sp. GA68]
MKKLTFTLAAAGLLASTAAMAQAVDAQQQTRASAAERAEQAFARMDANNDGVLDARDREARRQQMFERLDTNGDGQISRAEWNAAAEQRTMRQGRRGNAEGGERRGAWSRANSGAERTISRADFVAAATARFDRLDTNRDGTVSAEERQAARETLRGSRRSGE